MTNHSRRTCWRCMGNSFYERPRVYSNYTVHCELFCITCRRKVEGPISTAGKPWRTFGRQWHWPKHANSLDELLDLPRYSRIWRGVDELTNDKLNLVKNNELWGDDFGVCIEDLKWPEIYFYAKPFNEIQAKIDRNKKFLVSSEWRDTRMKVFERDGNRCRCCGRTPEHHGVVLHVDHIKPRSKFPHLALVLENLQVLCEDCNLGKSNRYQTDWRSSDRI